VATNIACGAFCARRRLNIKRGYPVTVNDAGFVDFRTLSFATELVGEDNYIPMPAPFMGAEDFSYVLQTHAGLHAVPGSHAGRTQRP